MPKVDSSEQQMFLLLVSCNDEAKKDLARMMDLIQRVDKQYMDKYAACSKTILFVALVGPYDFAIVFSGTNESALFLSALIAQKGAGMYETLMMPAVEMDTFRTLVKSFAKGK